MPKKTVCFYARQDTHAAVRYIDFYVQDIEALEALGYEVRIAIHPWELFAADLYYVWWWSHACFPVALASFLGKPVIITGTFNVHLYPKKPRWQKALIEYSLRRAASNIAVSTLEFDQLRTMFPEANWMYSPHCVNTSELKPGEGARENFVCTVAEMTVGNAERKCIPEIIRAIPLVAAQMPDIRFVLAGRIDEPFLRLAKEVGADRVTTFPGVVTKEEKIRLLQRCKVFLQPSRFEGFGLGILEAMSCGAPVVTSPAGAVPEVVGDGAEMVDGTSPERIADGILRLLRDPARCEFLGRVGRERAVGLFDLPRRKREVASAVESSLAHA